MKKIILLTTLLMLASCASIIDGTSQSITINTNPPGAKCDLHRQDTKSQDIIIGNVLSTPGSALIEKTKYDIKILCNKEGYQEASYMNRSGSAGSTWGNILLGGGIGWAVDSAKGADNKYDSPVNISLVPEEKFSNE